MAGTNRPNLSLDDFLSLIPEVDIRKQNDVLREEEERLNEEQQEALHNQKVLKLKLENRAIELENQTLEENIKLRRTFANKIFWVTIWWLISIILIVICSGLNTSWCVNVSDSVLITLITSTTVNTLGFFLLVVKYLFNTRPQNTKK